MQVIASERLADRGEVFVSDIYKSFGETKALNGCSFRARAGEIHAIVGENGSGKSTLAKILSGVLRPDRGTVSVFGHVPKSPREARHLGLVTIFQEIMVAEEATVVENLFAGTSGWLTSKLTMVQKREKAREIMKRLALQDVDPDARVAGLPLNIKQWIVIARALLANPKVLILDESSAALDLDATNRLHTEMRRIRDNGACVIIVTHRIAELVRIADHATILRDGALIGELAKEEITEHNLLKIMTARQGFSKATARTRTVRAAEQKTVLRAKDVSVHLNAETFDFALKRGEIVGVTGLDGQGQDHFVRLLAGILPPFSGSVSAIADSGMEHIVDDLRSARAHGISFVSGDRKREGIFPNLSVFENLALALYRKHSDAFGFIKRTSLQSLYETEVRRFGVKVGSARNKITTLSGGNQQKILISRAFADGANIIVLNDPARGVDLGTKRDLYEELKKHVFNGGSVIYLSSEIEEFLDFADRVVVFHKGTVFRTLDSVDINEDAMLAAMFGHHEPISYAKAEESVNAVR